VTAPTLTPKAGGRFGGALSGVPRWAWLILALAAAFLFPFLAPPIIQALLGGASDQDFLQASIETLGYIVMALGLNVVVGFAGLLDLGYVAFYAFGAYVAGWLMSLHFAEVDFHFLTSSAAEIAPGIHINFIFVVVIAGFFTAFWGAVLGAPTLRLRGDYLAIVTLAFGEIVPRVLENFVEISNGRQGITPVDRIYFPLIGELQYPEVLEEVYYVALALVLATLYINIRLRDSRLGRAWVAVREDEVAAAAMGVNLVRVKLWAYAIGAAFGGAAGSFLGAFRNVVNVDQFEFGFSVFILCMIILGGMGNIWGVILGAIALSMLDRFLLPQLDKIPESLGLEFSFTAVNFGIFGFFLLVMMVLRPEGFLPSSRRKLELHGDEVDQLAADQTAEAEPGEYMYDVRR
jgi:branched-chain amino acid transport system permease protein